MSLWLSQQEIDDLCDPLTQPAAQIRKLQELGVAAFMAPGRKKLVRVPRAAYEQWKNPPAEPAEEPAEEWPRRIESSYIGSPLHRYHLRLRETKAVIEAGRAALPQPSQRELLECEVARQEAIRLQKAATVRFHASKRRTLKMQRTPAWADIAAIRAVYLDAQRITRDTGVPHHVDHEIPLQGELVSGLHVHNNLQILTGSENSKKRNRYEVC